MYKQLHQITKSSHKDSLEAQAVGSLALCTAQVADHSPLSKLVILEDRPNFWDTRDVEIHHLEKATQLELVVAQGLLRGISACGGRLWGEQDRRYGASLSSAA
jgi:hypothetical protein